MATMKQSSPKRPSLKAFLLFLCFLLVCVGTILNVWYYYAAGYYGEAYGHHGAGAGAGAQQQERKVVLRGSPPGVGASLIHDPKDNVKELTSMLRNVSSTSSSSMTSSSKNDPFFYDRLPECIPCSEDQEAKLRNDVPQLIVPGIQKAGTTYFSSMMFQHPGAAMYMKEPQIFDQNSLAKGDSIDQCLIWREYKTFYKQCHLCKKHQLHMDKTPEYLFWSHTIPARLACVFPKPIKFLIFFRDPTSRAYSQYQMMIRNKRPGLDGTPGEFYRLIVEEKQLLDSSGVSSRKRGKEGFLSWKKYHQNFGLGIMGRGLYELQLTHWVETLSELWGISREDLIRNYFHFVDNDELLANTKVVMDGILNYTGLAPFDFDFEERRGVSMVHDYTRISDHEQNFLDEYYQPHNVDLHHFLEPFGVEIGFAKQAAEAAAKEE